MVFFFLLFFLVYMGGHSTWLRECYGKKSENMEDCYFPKKIFSKNMDILVRGVSELIVRFLVLDAGGMFLGY